jgi:hypothetical protein
MSATHRKFALAYLFLVGLPLVGLLCVLRAGRSLRAPTFIDGAWSIQTDADRLAAYACPEIHAGPADTKLVIAQSGRYLTAHLDNRAMVGIIDGTVIKASFAAPPNKGCPSDRVMSLAGSVHEENNSLSIIGTITAIDCPSCLPIDFRAVRPVAKPGEAH